MIIHLIAGARPNFMKIAPVLRAAAQHADRLTCRIVHTGQHYDRAMSEVFFEELGIPEPDFHLGCGGGSHAEQTAKIMVAYEKLCTEEKPDLVLVVGDVNSTLACAIVAKKLHVTVAHIEAGLRSGDREMPEEINRLVTDAISDLFFVTEPSGVEHLRREGKEDAAVHYVGHVMVDNVLFQRDRLLASPLVEGRSVELKKGHEAYGVVTMHRPSNVDEKAVFGGLARALREVSERLPLIFPAHPRTLGNMEKFGIDLGPHITVAEPLGYMDFLNLWKDAQLVLTDSGGLQEETTALGVPCLTMRENTERPVTVTEGTNVLVGTDPEAITAAATRILNGEVKAGRRPELWDGCAAERIIKILMER
ncbi:MAG: UDP-N-acetylglucosamine 2-epimerase (non-hydrolyzing) [Verrucomicrobia bacterium]|nr:UDP-N-acetylglucosamine 2-epimerase (non-hydrolyzing) [Verrucomicrobiota bacterium]